MTRRSTHVEMPLSYAAVGASNSPDLLRFPPEGSTPFEEEVRLGSGPERFLTSASQLMTWGAQRIGGYEVTDIVRGDGGHYTGVSFDADGHPEPAADVEDHFGPDGEPYLTAGTTATIAPPNKRESRAVKVVYVVDEPRLIGFAWGSADDAGVVGEQLFLVEHRADDTVWAMGRGFLSMPKNGLFGVKGRSEVKAAIARVKVQLGSLVPAAGAKQVSGASEDGASSEREPHAGPEADAETRVEADAGDPAADVESR